MTIIKLAGTWDDSSRKFWEIMEKAKMDKKLVPDDIDDTPVTAKNLSVAISSVQKTLVAKERSHGGQSIFSVTEQPEDIDEFPNIRLETISREDTSNLRIHALAVWKAYNPDAAFAPSDDQVTTLRKRNKKLYEKDAKTKTCGRKICDTRKACFTYRESQAKKKGSLYDSLLEIGRCLTEKISLLRFCQTVIFCHP